MTTIKISFVAMETSPRHGLFCNSEEYRELLTATEREVLAKDRFFLDRSKAEQIELLNKVMIPAIINWMCDEKDGTMGGLIARTYAIDSDFLLKHESEWGSLLTRLQNDVFAGCYLANFAPAEYGITRASFSYKIGDGPWILWLIKEEERESFTKSQIYQRIKLDEICAKEQP